MRSLLSLPFILLLHNRQASNDSLPQDIYGCYLRQRYFHPETKNVNAIVFLGLYIRHVKPFVDHKETVAYVFKNFKSLYPQK